jgi:hypothetical protein
VPNPSYSYNTYQAPPVSNNYYSTPIFPNPDNNSNDNITLQMLPDGIPRSDNNIYSNQAQAINYAPNNNAFPMADPNFGLGTQLDASTEPKCTKCGSQLNFPAANLNYTCYRCKKYHSSDREEGYHCSICHYDMCGNCVLLKNPVEISIASEDVLMATDFKAPEPPVKVPQERNRNRNRRNSFTDRDAEECCKCLMCLCLCICEIFLNTRRR